jgi:PTH1 family peptidyl-tRNA hydrolase
VQAFAKDHHLVFKAEAKFEGYVAHGMIEGQKVHLLLPMTYMNLSGRAVRKVVDFFKINASDTLVVSDDVALDLSAVRLRSKGSAGGHNGLKSIQEHLGTSEYPRLRIGIGDKVHGLLEDYVLGKFSKEEMSHLDGINSKGAQAISLWLKERIDIAMNLTNIRSRPPKQEKSSQERQTAQHNHQLPKVGEEKSDE